MYTGLSRSKRMHYCRTLSVYEIHNDERTADLYTGDDTNVYDYFMQLCTH